MATLRLYPYYRLVAIIGGAVVTGNAIKPHLEGMVVPVIAALQKAPYPVKPEDPALFNSYLAECKVINQVNQAFQQEWQQQFEDFANDLRNWPLVLARMCKVGTVPVGQPGAGSPIYEWKTDVDMGYYSHLQCAEFLMGKYSPSKRPADPIEFIANQKFG